MRIELTGFTPDQQKCFLDGVIQILDDAGRLHENWTIKGVPKRFVVRLNVNGWYGRISKTAFDRELPHVLRRFADWLAPFATKPIRRVNPR